MSEKRKYKAEEWGLLAMAARAIDTKEDEGEVREESMDEFLRACHDYHCDAYFRERTGLL